MLFDHEKGKVLRSRDVVVYEHKIGADLLNVDKATTSDLACAIDDTSTPIPVDRPTNEELDEVVLDKVGEVHPDGDALDELEYANDDDAPQYEEVHEQGEQLVPPVHDVENADTVEVQRSTRGQVPLKRYLSSTYILVTDEGDP